jgi:fumarate hydratase subunit alpha
VREITAGTVTETLRDLFIAANLEVGRDMLNALARAAEEEESPLGRYVLQKILEILDVA